MIINFVTYIEFGFHSLRTVLSLYIGYYKSYSKNFCRTDTCCHNEIFIANGNFILTSIQSSAVADTAVDYDMQVVTVRKNPVYHDDANSTRKK